MQVLQNCIGSGRTDWAEKLCRELTGVSDLKRNMKAVELGRRSLSLAQVPLVWVTNKLLLASEIMLVV